MKGILFVTVFAGENFNLLQYSFFTVRIHIGQPYINLFAGISLEAILITIGGLIIDASVSD